MNRRSYFESRVFLTCAPLEHKLEKRLMKKYTSGVDVVRHNSLN